MSSPVPARTHVIAVVIATAAALIGRAWLQINLLEDGYETRYAADLAYLVVPPVLLVLLLPVIAKDRDFIGRQFHLEDISVRLVLMAISTGLLFRIAWHSQIVARIFFGVLPGSSPDGVVGPEFRYDYPATHLLLLGVFVASFLVPLIEEMTHRGYVQTFFGKHGPFGAVSISTLTFVVFHRWSGWDFAFVGGLVLGTLYWITGSLWAPVISHAVVNLVPQLTLRYVSIQWSPRAASLPLWTPGLIAATISLIAVAGIIWLLIHVARVPGRRGPGTDRLKAK